MNLHDVMSALESLGSDQSKKVLTRHGAREPFFGVKVADLKKVISQIKKSLPGNAIQKSEHMHHLALELYQTGNSDAMYMAGLMIDGSKMSREELDDWAQKAYWYMLSDFTVAWTASVHRDALNIAKNWIDSDQEFVMSAGWATLGSMVAVRPDDEIDISEIEALIDRVERDLHKSPNRVRYAMNGFVIAAGSCVPALTEKCKSVGRRLGVVQVDMGGTSCKVPNAVEYIEKVEQMGRLGKKRSGAVC